MEVSIRDYSLLRAIAEFIETKPLSGKAWMIRGAYREGITMLMGIFSGKDHLSPFQLEAIGIPHFRIPYTRVFLSYQERIRDKHAAYYQQRFNATETDEVQSLKHYLFGSNPDLSQTRHLYPLLEKFRLRHLLPEAVIKLSNGETRKATILKALLDHPQLLVLEDPYVGIDQQSIPELDHLFSGLLGEGYGILLFSNAAPRPWIQEYTEISSSEDFLFCSGVGNLPNHQPVDQVIVLPEIFLPPTPEMTSEFAIRLHKVTVAYGEKQVLRQLTWEIRTGEKWHLLGKNGAGKSTLLALIYADHPQSYANDLEIFGCKRGQGESIWDIKEKIAYCSPEIYQYFDKHQTCREALLSGIYLHPFKKGKRKPEQEEFASQLFTLFFQEEQLEDPLYKLSGIEQRLVILLRALAQNAPLVLLDEPFQGFDPELTARCKALTAACCIDKTLIFVSHAPGDLPGNYKPFLLGGQDPEHAEG